MAIAVAIAAAIIAAIPTTGAAAAPVGIELALTVIDPKGARGLESQPGMPGPFTIYFDFDSARVVAHFRPAITAAAAAAKAHPGTKIRIIGHADRAGGQAYNMRLSLARANAVRAALIRAAVAPSRISVAGAGESRPERSTPDGVRHGQNRRAWIIFE